MNASLQRRRARSTTAIRVTSSTLASGMTSPCIHHQPEGTAAATITGSAGESPRRRVTRAAMAAPSQNSQGIRVATTAPPTAWGVPRIIQRATGSITPGAYWWLSV